MTSNIIDPATRCGRCKYYFGNEQKGECRLKPPSCFPSIVQDSLSRQQVITHGYFPPVTAADTWCGEFKPKLDS